jgi:ATP-dependent Clp protease ATP-binding subunit ClpX
MSNQQQNTSRCGFCGRARNEVKALISGGEKAGPFICNHCVDQAHKTIEEQMRADPATKEEPLKKPCEIQAFLDEHVIGQTLAKREVAIAVYEHYKRREALRRGRITIDTENGVEVVELEKSNIILMGPSGSGKTHIARAVAKMLRIPFYVADATRLTQAGYVGDDVESLLQGLIADADGDLERAQWGIIFIDEFDKLARKSGRGASGYRDVTGEGVQQALLKLLEGTRIPVPRGMGNKMVFAGGGGADMIDTTNILFIGAGSFAGIEEIVERRVNKGTRMGFGGGEKTALDKTAVYSQVTEEDILEFGMIPELVGRMPVLTTVLDLTEEELIRVLTEPKSAIIKQFRAMYAMENIDLQFDPAALKLIAQRAKKHPTGARALRSVVKKVLSPYSFDAPSDSTIRAIRITEEAVSEPGKAIIVRHGVKTASA